MSQITLRQQYEFSAAHRLHVPELSEHENRRIFGKCNNPAGHGHNYRIEVAVRGGIDRHGQAVDVATLDELVERHVIRKLDHTHLNHDIPEFSRRNPSVEHIAEFIWGLLDEPVAHVGTSEEPVRLEEIRIWETEKTVCTYRGE